LVALKRLASEIFLSSRQSGFFSNRLETDQSYKFRSTKTEARNKFKIMKNKSTAMLQTGRVEFTVLDFLILNLCCRRFVSNFDIRISDFVSMAFLRHRSGQT